MLNGNERDKVFLICVIAVLVVLEVLLSMGGRLALEWWMAFR